jgi:hypothetical protein
MSKFQVGDRVEFTEDYHTTSAGTQGTLKDVCEHDDEPGDRLVTVEVEGLNDVAVYDKRLKHVEAVPVAKEFRFFRRGDSSISMQPYETFEAALQGWKPFAQDGQEVEIIEVVSHGKYKATLKIEEAL